MPSPKQSVLNLLLSLTNPFKHDNHEQNLQLQAIINNKALLNGQWHTIGDVVNGYTLIAFHPKGIILQKSNTHFKLLLNGELEKLEP